MFYSKQGKVEYFEDTGSLVITALLQILSCLGCQQLPSCHRIIGSSSLLGLQNPEHEGTVIFQNVGNYLLADLL